MNKVFNRLSDGKEVNLINYIRDVLSKNNALVYVATDSQSTKRHTVYATVVVLHYAMKQWNSNKLKWEVIGGKGAHVLYCIESVPKIKDIGYRLFKETELSMEVGTYLVANNISVDNMHLDYNSRPNFKSNEILKNAIGWVEASGFAALAKPGTSATYAANKLCRTKRPRKVKTIV